MVRHARPRVAYLLLALLFPLTALAAPPAVIVLSWDGTRHDYPARAATPALDRMARDGARAARLTPVFPANTFPNHVALATGTYVDRHGIVANSFSDRKRGRFHYSKDASWIDAEPLWAAAERQGLRAATFFWVGSETDWRGTGASYRRTPFDGRISEARKVDQILAWLDLPEQLRPSLIMSWWHGCDSVGHRLGPEHAAVDRQLEQQDHQLGRLLSALDERALWDRVTLLVLGDHGMAETRYSVDVLGPLARRGIKAEITRGGGMAYLRLADVERGAEAVALLNELEHVRAFRSDALPDGLRAYRPARSGQVVVVTEPPYAFKPSLKRGLLGALFSLLGRRSGTHGYLPERAEMGSIFFALGRGVPAGAELGVIRAIDVAPTVSRLLGIDPPKHSEGKAIASLGD